MKRPTLLLPLGVIILFSCQGTNPPIQNRDFNEFWALDSRIGIEMTLSDETLGFIQTYGQEKNGPYNDYYFPVSFRLTMNDQTYEIDEVGIRQKGNIFSRGPFLDETGKLTNPFHFRLSFDQTFDAPFYESLGLQKSWQNGEPAYESRQKRRLFGMKSLELKWNRSNDPSLVNQLFASQLFKSEGALAPAATLAKVSLMTESQGHDVGIYIVNEAIDQTFIERNFSGAAATGDLYKALWSNQLLLEDMATFDANLQDYVFKREKVGIENTEEFYHPVYDLKTNQQTSTHHDLMQLIKTLHTLNSIQDIEIQRSTLNRVLDVDAFLKYAAISYLSGNPDDMRNLTNNTYIYFHGVSKQAYFIPYDMDWSLGLTWDENLSDKMATHSALSIKDSFEQTIRNPLYWYTILDGFVNQANRYPRIAGYQEIYLEQIQTVLSSDHFSIEQYQTMFNTKATLYASDTFTIASASEFQNIQLFIQHHNKITAVN
ncbi:MAG: CotH kinase family protein [Bacilli bacterium]